MFTDPSPGDTRQPGRLIAFRADRLGARLVSLLNAMRLASDHGADFACAWADTSGVGHVFNDPTELFEPVFVARHFLDADAWRAHRPDCRPLTAQLQQSPSGVVEALAAGQDLIVGNAFGIVRLTGENRQDVERRFRAQFDRIPFAPAVRSAMAALAGAVRGLTACHIRRGDLTGDLKAMNKPWPHKVVPDEFYEAHIHRTLENGTGGVVLFTDDAPSIDHYKGRFPALRTLADLTDTGTLTEAQRDLIELYAMSRCATIVAPGRSAFSSTAADLSGARRVDAARCLSATQHEAALRALYERLRDRPESFPGPGEIAQSLAHVGPWLEGGERWTEAADLFAARVAGGLNISFIYPQTMVYQHRAGDVGGVIATADLMRARPAVHVRDQARAEILHGYAHLRLGSARATANEDALATGLRHIVNGFWHAPTLPACRAVVPFLLENGVLHDRNFLPSTPLVRGLATRRGPLKALVRDYPELAVMPGLTVPRAVGAMEPVLWDWAPLMRSFSLLAEIRRGSVARFAEIVAALPDDPATAIERRSLLAFYQAISGRAGAAIECLSALALRSPHDAMVHQRLSHALRIVRDFTGAAEAAARAAALAPDWPVLRTWAGLSLLRARQHDRAAGHLRIAAGCRIGLPSVHALLAETLQNIGDRDGALAQIRVALDLAPLEVGAAMRIARLLDQAGRPSDAAGHLTALVAADRAPAKVFLLLVGLLERAGKIGEATEMAREARRRSPDHPAIADLARRLAA